ncbi:transposase [Streptomyces sp. NPDC014734]|uniref:transposase n=1 Tax=Streptomyces sp. NPDC014734 TaxID=3364886 RepID=UPI0036F6ED15
MSLTDLLHAGPALSPPYATAGAPHESGSRVRFPRRRPATARATPPVSQRLVPDELRELAAPLPPSFAARPQGGGTAPCDERAVFTAVVYVLTSDCARRHLPPAFGTSPATAHRRFTVWTEAGLWRRLHRAVLDGLGARGEVDWTSAIVDAASVRAKDTSGGKKSSWWM